MSRTSVKKTARKLLDKLESNQDWALAPPTPEQVRAAEQRGSELAALHYASLYDYKRFVKECSVCGQVLSMKHFHRDGTGYKSVCKECSK